LIIPSLTDTLTGRQFLPFFAFQETLFSGRYFRFEISFLHLLQEALFPGTVTVKYPIKLF